MKRRLLTGILPVIVLGIATDAPMLIAQSPGAFTATGKMNTGQRRLPHGLVVTVKAPGALTHAKRLYGPESWLARMGQGLDHLGPKREVLLVQLPPSIT